MSIPNTRRIDFVSQVNGHRYSISVALPFEPAPPKGYGVLYVLDGYGYFASATEAVRANGNAPGVIVVGIGYPDDPQFIAGVLKRHPNLPAWSAASSQFQAAAGLERNYDLSLPASDSILAEQNIPGLMETKREDVGGVDDFLKTIETEVKPRVYAMAPVDPANQALFGHSLGGLAVVQALFTEPTAFKSFIAASPSIWWAHNAVLAGEAGFAARVTSGTASPRVMITMGGDESLPPKLPASMHISPERVDVLVHMARMVENGRELTSRLQALNGRRGYMVNDYVVFDHQSHGISPWPALGRAIAFAFPPGE